MMGPAHSLSGAAAWLGVGALAAGLHHPMPWPTLVVGALICAGAALAPDLDHKPATISRAFGSFSRAVCEVVERISCAVYNGTRMKGDPHRNGGHRTLTHTWPWALMCGAGASAACVYGGRWGVLAVLFVHLVLAIDGLLWQECRAGVLPMRVEGEGADRCLLLKSPGERVLETGRGAHPLLAAALAGIGEGALPPALVDGGRRWWLAEVESETALRAWRPDHSAIGALAHASDSMGLCAFARSAHADYQLVVRAFPAGVGIIEDPASGAANGLIAAYVAQAEPHGPLARGYVVSQGREIGHDAQLVARIADGAVWIGGRTHTVVDGTLHWNEA